MKDNRTITHSSTRSIVSGWVLFILFSSFSISSFSQDIIYSLPQLTPMKVNPANVGWESDLRGILNHRTRSKASGSPVKSIAASFDMALSKPSATEDLKNKFALGLGFSRDRYEPIGAEMSKIDFNAAYHLRISQTAMMAAGLSATLDQKRFGSGEGRWGSQYTGYEYDPSISSGEASFADKETALDMGLGVIFKTEKEPTKRNRYVVKKLEAGLGAYHIGNVKISESQSLHLEEQIRYSAFLTYQFPMSEVIGLAPAAYFDQHQGHSRFTVGSQIMFLLIRGKSFIHDLKTSYLSVGVFARTTSTVIFQTEARWGDYTIGLAYDLSNSDAKEYVNAGNAVEIGLKWTMNRKP